MTKLAFVAEMTDNHALLAFMEGEELSRNELQAALEQAIAIRNSNPDDKELFFELDSAIDGLTVFLESSPSKS